MWDGFSTRPPPKAAARSRGRVENPSHIHLAKDAMRAGTRASSYQAMVCDYFEARGYPTIRSHPTTADGYVHSLGHGVGLDIHEKPNFTLIAMNAVRTLCRGSYGLAP